MKITINYAEDISDNGLVQAVKAARMIRVSAKGRFGIHQIAFFDGAIFQTRYTAAGNIIIDQTRKGTT